MSTPIFTVSLVAIFIVVIAIFWYCDRRDDDDNQDTLHYL